MARDNLGGTAPALGPLDAASRGDGAQAHAPDDAEEPDLGIVLLPARREARIDGFDPSA